MFYVFSLFSWVFLVFLFVFLVFSNVLSERLLDKFSSFFLKFCFGPLSDPRGSFGTKKSAIDVKNIKESENSIKNPKKLIKKQNKNIFKKKTPAGIFSELI